MSIKNYTYDADRVNLLVRGLWYLFLYTSTYVYIDKDKWIKTNIFVTILPST